MHIKKEFLRTTNIVASSELNLNAIIVDAIEKEIQYQMSSLFLFVWHLNLQTNNRIDIDNEMWSQNSTKNS